MGESWVLIASGLRDFVSGSLSRSRKWRRAWSARAGLLPGYDCPPPGRKKGAQILGRRSIHRDGAMVKMSGWVSWARRGWLPWRRALP